MFGKGLLVILVLTTVTHSFGDNAEVSVEPQPPPTVTTTTSAPNTTTTKATTTAPTTTKPTTTIAPNTTTTKPTTTAPTTTKPTTTIAPNTTTTKPTTTVAPNTTTPTTPTTTPAAPTTTPAAPTTTVAPPVPQPEVGKWTVRDSSTNVTCIIANMAIQLNITHKDSHNKTFMLIDVPKTANATGKCGSDVQLLQLSWPSANKSNELIVLFKKNVTAKDFSVDFNVTLEIPEDKNVTELKYKNALPAFTTPDDKSYRCLKAQQVNLTYEGSNITVAYLTISNTQFEAFHNKTDENFSSAKDCEPSSSPDIVPIAVGCALVGLVAIVLIAYLVGRRRSQARGYLSM